jgi:hypothetical protein
MSSIISKLPGEVTFTLKWALKHGRGNSPDVTVLAEGAAKTMKAITRSTIYLPIAAMILTATLAVPAAAQKQVPFKGALQGIETQGPGLPGTILADGSVTGIASELGSFAMTYHATVNVTDGSGVGTGQFSAANGDTVSYTFVAQLVPIDTADTVDIVEMCTITGGTGRFAGAKGIFRLARLLNFVAGNTSGSFEGTITSPGAAH